MEESHIRPRFTLMQVELFCQGMRDVLAMDILKGYLMPEEKQAILEVYDIIRGRYLFYKTKEEVRKLL